MTSRPRAGRDIKTATIHFTDKLNKAFLSTVIHQDQEVGFDLQVPQQTGQENNSGCPWCGGLWHVLMLSPVAIKKNQNVTLLFQLQQTIMKYNPKYKGQWSFDALANFVKVSVPVFKQLNQ